MWREGLGIAGCGMPGAGGVEGVMVWVGWGGGVVGEWGGRGVVVGWGEG